MSIYYNQLSTKSSLEWFISENVIVFLGLQRFIILSGSTADSNCYIKDNFKPAKNKKEKGARSREYRKIGQKLHKIKNRKSYKRNKKACFVFLGLL